MYIAYTRIDNYKIRILNKLKYFLGKQQFKNVYISIPESYTKKFDFKMMRLRIVISTFPLSVKLIGILVLSVSGICRLHTE